MTTIACDGTSLSSDGQITHSSDRIIRLDFCKLRKLRSGGVIGVSGSAFDVQVVADWLDRNHEKYPLGNPDDDHRPILWDKTSFVLLTPTLDVWFYGSDCNRLSVPSQYAIGTGSDYALGVMAVGNTSEEAVRTACRFDVFSGGEIYTMRPDPPARKGSWR